MKRSVKLVLAGLAVVMAVAGLAGCGQDKAGGTAKKPETINMTYVKSPLNIPSIIEKKDQVFEKAFKDDGISITYSDLDAGPKQTEALAEKSTSAMPWAGPVLSWPRPTAST